MPSELLKPDPTSPQRYVEFCPPLTEEEYQARDRELDALTGPGTWAAHNFDRAANELIRALRVLYPYWAIGEVVGLETSEDPFDVVIKALHTARKEVA